MVVSGRKAEGVCVRYGVSIFELYINLLKLRIGVRVSVIDGTGLFITKSV